jgi:hypothetical protein
MGTAAVAVHRWWRAVAVLAATALLACVPVIIGALPVSTAAMSPGRLLARIQHSAPIQFSGLVQSQGNLGLPDLPHTGPTGDLLGGIVRIREWWAGPERWRVDQLSDAGELDTYPTPDGSLQWNSLGSQLTRIFGATRVHEPTALDLTPPSLGRRLADAAAGSTLTRIGSARIAGQDAVGIRVSPLPGTTTLGHIDLWATAAGLPVRIQVYPTGSDTPAVTTTFLSLSLGAPSRSVTSFRPPPGAAFNSLRAPDYVASADQGPPLQLPPRLAGLPRSSLVGGTASGVATYSRGYALLTVIPLPFDIAQQAFRALQPPVGEQIDGHAALLESLPLFTVVVGFDAAQHVPYLLVGTLGSSALSAVVQRLSPDPEDGDG